MRATEIVCIIDCKNRKVTHNRFFADIHQLEDTVDQYYKQFSATNEELKSLCSFNFFNDSSCADGTLVA